MSETPRCPREAWIPLIAGFIWLWNAPSHGFFGFVFSTIPGCLLLGSGMAMLLMPGDLRISQFAALGGVLGVIFALPAFVVIGPLYALFLIGISIASFLAAGEHTVRLEPQPEDVPPPRRSMKLAAQVGADEALLAGMTASIAMPNRSDQGRIDREIAEAREVFDAKGWLEKPADYHQTPPALEEPMLRPKTLRGLDYEHLSFESGYEPHPEEPARERWLAYGPNRTGHAWVLRHSDADRPWVMCIHGYQMGRPAVDLYAMEAARFHHRLGLNVMLPVLPLHGPRRIGRISGDGFLNGDVVDTVHAEANAMWDLRRLLSWARAQGDARVGVIGLSLGGYNTALLSCLDADLACAVPGIPATDFTRLFFRHGPPLQVRDAAESGIDEDRMREVLSVVSPLVLEPLVPKERRFIFGAVADRLVPADQVRDLWRHWDQPRIEWYQGAHVTFRAHPQIRAFMDDSLRESGLIL